jgi:HD-GYP domain-containing protein (c-di-GMP phosphodiesterase class II)
LALQGWRSPHSRSGSPMAMVEFVSAWLQGLKQYDQGTYWHSVRTAQYFVQFMDYLGIHGERARYLYESAALHDIGKLAVPQPILQKKGGLSCSEYRAVKKHPQLAFEWMSLLRDSVELITIPYLHHERWDGSGYPLSLRGRAIPYHVRIFSVIDVWEAMSVDRPYRRAIPQTAILKYIARSSSTLFDPEVVDAFLRWRKKDGVGFRTKLVCPVESDSQELFIL